MSQQSSGIRPSPIPRPLARLVSETTPPLRSLPIELKRSSTQELDSINNESTPSGSDKLPVSTMPVGVTYRGLSKSYSSVQPKNYASSVNDDSYTASFTDGNKTHGNLGVPTYQTSEDFAKSTEIPETILESPDELKSGPNPLRNNKIARDVIRTDEIYDEDMAMLTADPDEMVSIMYAESIIGKGGSLRGQDEGKDVEQLEENVNSQPQSIAQGSEHGDSVQNTKKSNNSASIDDTKKGAIFNSVKKLIRQISTGRSDEIKNFSGQFDTGGGGGIRAGVPASNISGGMTTASGAYQPSSRKFVVKKTPKDFDFGDLLGEGAYGKVYHARLKATNQEFAIKMIDRRFILRHEKKKYILREKQALSIINHPNLMKLYFAFQDDRSLYFVLEYCEAGELLRQIKEAGGCTLPQVKFYAAEILLAIEHLHSRKIIHRDLKPENILLRANGHIVVTDFGTARIVADDEADLTTGDLKDRKNSFVGSADYVPPEILANEPAGFAADLWSFGCVIYTLIERRSPFRAENEYLTFQRILRLDLNFPQGFPEDARDLITKLLQRNPSSRLGAPPNSLSDIRKHPFFNGIDFENINSMEAPSRTRDKILIESKSYTDPNAKWRRFIRANEEILLAGYVIKRKGLFSKRRLLILSDYPRLVYVNVKKMEKRGEIPWSAGLRAELKDGNSFYIHTHSRSYYMQAEGISAQTWVEEINKPKRNFVESDLLPPPLDKSRKSRLSYLD